MAIYRSVHLSFWTDNKVEDEFTPEDKFFYLYLLTNPQTNICGCYEISYSSMCRHTGYDKNTIIRLIKRFQDVHKMIVFNEETKELLILHWYKYNWSESEKTLVGVESVARYIKYDKFKKYILNIVNDIRAGKLKKDTSDTKSETKPIKSKNKFNNFHQRDYNFDEIEKNLIAK